MSPKILPLEDGYKLVKSNGSSLVFGYTVEARYDFYTPIKIGGQLFDNRWQQVTVTKSDFGIPVSRHDENLAEHGLLSYPVAQALRWWFIAFADAEVGKLCVETRLIKHKLRCTSKVEAVGFVSDENC